MAHFKNCIYNVSHLDDFGLLNVNLLLVFIGDHQKFKFKILKAFQVKISKSLNEIPNFY